MAKFDEEEWRKRIEREIEEEDIQAQMGRDAKMDMEFLGDAYYLLDINPSEIAELGKNIPDLVSTDDALRQIAKGKKAYKKGQKAKAKKILSANKDLKKLAKQAAKKKKGCAVVALFMLAVGGSTLAAVVYGTVEVVSALVR